jgi:uncharacterized protein YPO0396
MGSEDYPARRYFHLLRKDRQNESPLSEDLCSIIDGAVGHIRDGDLDAAINDLSSAKETIAILSPLIDDTQSRHADLIEIMTLRKQILEEKNANALLRGEEDEAAELEKQIDDMDGFFSAAISDLDEPGA